MSKEKMEPCPYSCLGGCCANEKKLAEVNSALRYYREHKDRRCETCGEYDKCFKSCDKNIFLLLRGLDTEKQGGIEMGKEEIEKVTCDRCGAESARIKQLISVIEDNENIIEKLYNEIREKEKEYSCIGCSSEKNISDDACSSCKRRPRDDNYEIKYMPE